MAKYRVIESVSVADQTFEVGAEVELEEAVAQPLVDEGKLGAYLKSLMVM